MMGEENFRIPKIVGYARVSTADQKENGASLDIQRAKIIEKAQEFKGELIEIYHDDGKTGTNMNRPGLNQLLARCSKKDITHLIVFDSSRLSRDTKDYLTIRTLLKKYKVQIIALTGISSFDNDPYSMFFDEILAAVNALHPRISGFKARQTAVEKFKNGIYPSWAPLGYKNVVNPNPTNSYDRRIVVPDETTAPFITQAFKMYGSGGYAIFDIRMFLHNNGLRGKLGKPVQYSIVHNTLRNPFYYGLMRWGGMEGIGKHQPLIDKPTFDLIQGILAEKGDYGIRKRKHNFLLRGFVFCKHCHKRYVAEWHYHPKFKSRNGRIGYYHCSQVGKRGRCSSKYVLLEDLETQVEKEVAKLEFKPEFVEAVKRNLREVYEGSINRVKAVKKALYNRKTALEEKRERLEEELLVGTLDREAFKRNKVKIEAELLGVQKELLEIEKIRTIDIDIIEEVLSITRNIARTYKEADINRKRAYLHFFFKEFWVKDKQIIDIMYQPAIGVLKQADSVILSTDWLPNSRRLRITISSILKAFEDLVQVELLKVRWEEIKRLQQPTALSIAKLAP